MVSKEQHTSLEGERKKHFQHLERFNCARQLDFNFNTKSLYHLATERKNFRLQTFELNVHTQLGTPLTRAPHGLAVARKPRVHNVQ